MGKFYPQHEPDADYKQKLGEVARQALVRRDAQRRWREAQDSLASYWARPTKDEIDGVIEMHERRVAETMKDAALKLT